MKTTAIFLAAALSHLAAAAPAIGKRNIVHQTVIIPVVETVVVTTTITLAPSEAAPSPTPPVPAEAEGKQKAPPVDPKPTPEAAPVPAPVPQPQQLQKEQPKPSPQPQPQPALQPEAKPAPVQPPQSPAPPKSSSGGLGGKMLSGASHDTDCTAGSPCTGQGTFYATGMGSCGSTSSDGEMVLAISHLMMGDQSNGNPLCGKSVSITAPNGKTQAATVVDKCMGCADGPTNIDLSPALFEALGYDQAKGVIPGLKWYFS